MSRRPPIGIQDFRTIREKDFYYVDKTPSSGNWWRKDASISCYGLAGSARACCWTR